MILLFILLWVISGFLGFLIYAKLEGWTNFNDKVIGEFWACIILGVISLLLFLPKIFFKNLFINFMNWLLNKINGKNKKDTYEETKL